MQDVGVGGAKQEGGLRGRGVALKEGSSGRAPGAEAAKAAPPALLVSKGSSQVTSSWQLSLVSPAPMPSPPSPLLQEAFLRRDLPSRPFGTNHCLPFLL